jgi:SP family arabinose:H+ symporter-like MFS transporter
MDGLKHPKASAAGAPQAPAGAQQRRALWRVGLSVALGGFLMGFDASVVSGVVRFIRPEFGLSDLGLGWAVGSLTLTATLGMLTAGPLSDRLGRRAILLAAAVLYAISAVASALAVDLVSFVIARMIGGLGVGASLIVGPMYLAEIAPPKIRGRLVSLNQLNIVIGISAAFFSNYLFLQLAQSSAQSLAWLSLDTTVWRWMLAIETLPALLFLMALWFVPQSPRWLMMRGREAEAVETLSAIHPPEAVALQIQEIQQSLSHEGATPAVPLKALFDPALRWLLVIGLALAVLQQITGINAVFFYAPMIFEQSGLGADAAFLQAVLVGLTNLAFTVVAMLLIDRLGRRPLLIAGLSGIAVSMFVLALGFGSAKHSLSPERIDAMALPPAVATALKEAPLKGAPTSFEGEGALRAYLLDTLGVEDTRAYGSEIVKASASVNTWLILLAILGFVASFAVSIGPVMWVMLSELFPLRVRGLAVSVAGFVNSSVSFVVQLLFPWQLSTLGTSKTFLIFGAFGLIGLLFVARFVPETRQKSLEQLDREFRGAKRT